MTNEKVVTNLPKSHSEGEKQSEVPAVFSNQTEKNISVEILNPNFSNSGVNIRSLRLNSDITPTYYQTEKTEINPEISIEKINTDIPGKNVTSSIISPSQEDSSHSSDPQQLLESVLSSVEKENDRFYLIKQLKNQLSRIYEMSLDKKVEPYYVNLTNKIYQKANIEKLREFLLNSGFRAESASKLVFDVNRTEDLEKAILIIEEYENKIEENKN